ncbi:MAG: helix-turn-helix domain-containing protein [Fibrobacter sp.]|nr:helix-turn-helix domain-containing protein [Fibrobacter sp.]
MLPQDTRTAINSLHKEGMSIREISRCLKVNRKTVKNIIAQDGIIPILTRTDKIVINEELLRSLHQKCNGYIQRVHEILTEEHKIEIAYSTLCAKIAELGLSKPQKQRCDRVGDEPGSELQHDTSEYTIEIGGKKTKVIGSVLYFRYSKIRYLKFYKSFNRFKMKCFFHEALMFWGHVAPLCVIDNTNLARLRGSGKNAVIVPEMEQFAKMYGFAYVCHEINHSNRKAGEERSFFTITTNFIPGRTFESMEDLNTQAHQWATVRFANRPVSKTGLIPVKAFEYEQSFLQKVSSFVPAPYLTHQRRTDQYGYISFDGNYYWIPGTRRDDITVLQYSNCIKLYLKRAFLIEYALPQNEEIKNQLFNPPGRSAKQHPQPRDRKNASGDEEKKLRAISNKINDYLTFALEGIDRVKYHRFVRQLYSLSLKLAPQLFRNSIERALQYRIKNIETIERIALLQMGKGDYSIPLIDYDHEFIDRDTYREGS